MSAFISASQNKIGTMEQDLHKRYPINITLSVLRKIFKESHCLNAPVRRFNLKPLGKIYKLKLHLYSLFPCVFAKRLFRPRSTLNPNRPTHPSTENDKEEDASLA
jgi:hypothetical protein